MNDDDISALDFDIHDAVPGEPVDMTALLTRRFAWDTTQCTEVRDLLPKLGLVLGAEDGLDIEHRESHQRMAPVFPLEYLLQSYSSILGVIMTTHITSAKGIDLPEEDSVGFAAQNSEVILHSARAIIAQLMYLGVIEYGPVIKVSVTEMPADGLDQIAIQMPEDPEPGL